MREPHPSRRERERHYRRTVLAGLAISLAFHVVVVLFISRQLAIPPLRYTPRPARVPAFQGLQGLNLRLESGPAAESAPSRPRRPESRSRTGVGDTARAATRSPESGRPSEPITNAEKLKPKPGDLRVWQPIRPGELPPPSMAELARADSAVRAIIGAYLDSLQLSAEAEKRAREWLVHKGDRSWGIAPDGLHLGKIVIPIPFGQLLQPYGEKARELEQQLRDLQIIHYQDQLQEARKVRQEREKAMEKRAHDVGSPTPTDTSGVPPDTTGGG